MKKDTKKEVASEKKSIKENKVVKFILWAVLIVIVCFAFKETTNVEKKDIFVTCVDKTGSKLVNETRNIKYKERQEFLNKVALELKKAPSDKKLSKLIPENVEVENVLINSENGELNISLSKDFNDLSSQEQRLLMRGILQTFQQFDYVKGVEFFVNGEPMKKENGEEVGVLTEKDVVTDVPSQTQQKKDVEVKLYFVDRDLTGLITEKRKVTTASDETLPKTVIEELIKGPASGSTLISPIPKDTELKEIEVKDGICYADFNEKFKTNHVGGSDMERMTIYSIVNTLTELKGITKVQFLIEGQKQEIYKGHYEFDVPFERDDSIIVK